MSFYGDLKQDTGPGPRDPDCPICIFSFSPDASTLTHTPGCGHSIHADCLLPWLNNLYGHCTTITCPVCRGTIPSPPEVDQIIDELASIKHRVLAQYAADPVNWQHPDPALRERANTLIRRLLTEYQQLDPQTLNNRLEAARHRVEDSSATPTPPTATLQPPTPPESPERSSSQNPTTTREYAHRALIHELGLIRQDFDNSENQDLIQHWMSNSSGPVPPELVQHALRRLASALRNFEDWQGLLQELLREVMEQLTVVIRSAEEREDNNRNP